MNPPHFDLVITGLLALVVLAAVVAASPGGVAAPVIQDDPSLELVDRSPRSSSPDERQAGPGHGAPVEAQAAQEESEPRVGDAGSDARPPEMRSGVATGVTGMAMGLGMAALLGLMMWAMAMSWRTRARV